MGQDVTLWRLGALMWGHATVAVSVAAVAAIRHQRHDAGRRERNAFELGRDAERLLFQDTDNLARND